MRESGAPGGEDAGEKETGRVEAFSDGVFAIAMTLLVLDLKVPRDLAGPEGLLPARGKRLLDPRCTRSEVETINRQYAFGPVLYFAAFVLAFWSVPASLCPCMGLAAFFAVTASFRRSPGPGNRA